MVSAVHDELITERSWRLAEQLFPDADMNGTEWELLRAGIAISDVLHGRLYAVPQVEKLSFDQIEDFALGYGFKKALAFRDQLDREVRLDG